MLRQFIDSIQKLTEEEWQALEAIWQPYDCKRKTILTAAGETEKHLYFVLEGLQRAYYIGERGQEATIVFTYAPSFSGVADSFLTQTPSLYFMETLTASRFLRTTHQQWEKLLKDFPPIQQMAMKMTAHVLKGVLARQVEIQCFTAEEKFRTFLNRSPHVLQLIPHKYLASYMGIDPSTFSKLLASVRL